MLQKTASPKQTLTDDPSPQPSCVVRHRDAINHARNDDTLGLHVDLDRPADRFDATWSFVARIAHVRAHGDHAQLHRHAWPQKIGAQLFGILFAIHPTQPFGPCQHRGLPCVHERQSIVHRARYDRKTLDGFVAVAPAIPDAGQQQTVVRARPDVVRQLAFAVLRPFVESRDRQQAATPREGFG